MNEDFEALQTRHLRLLEQVKQRPEARKSLKEVEDFIAACREAGRHVSDPAERDQLRAFIRYWATFVYERTGGFPRTQLEPLAIEAVPVPPSKRPAVAPARPWYAWGSLRAVLGVAILLLAAVILRGPIEEILLTFIATARLTETLTPYPTATATACPTATLIPSPTATAAVSPILTPTPTPLPFPTAYSGEILVLIANFDGKGGKELQKMLGQNLEARLGEIGAPSIRILPLDRLRDEDEARALGQAAGASLIIWGNMKNERYQANLTFLKPSDIDFKRPEGWWPLLSVEPRGFSFELEAVSKSHFSFLTDFSISLIFHTSEGYPSSEIIDRALKALGTKDVPAGIASAYFYRGYSYQVSSFEWKRAEADYTKAIAIDSRFAAAYNNRGWVILELEEDSQRAIKDFDKAIRFDPQLAPAYLSKVIALWDAAEQITPPLFETMLELVNKSIKADSGFVLSHFVKGVVLYEQGDYSGAIASLSQAIKLQPDFFDAYLRRAEVYTAIKDYTKAVADLDAAAQLYPDDYSIYYQRGLANAALHNYEQAIEDYSKALAIFPQYALVHHQRGIAYRSIQKYEQAINDFDTALELMPQSASVFYDRGFTHYLDGNYKKAIDDLSTAIELDPNLVDAYLLRGAANRSLKDYEAAIADYTTVIKLDPKQADAYSGRGLTYYFLKKYKEAIADYSKAIELKPEDASTYYDRGLIYRELEKAEEAINDFRAYLKHEPNAPEREQIEKWIGELKKQ